MFILVHYGFEDTWESGLLVEKHDFIDRFKSVVWAREQNKIMNMLDRGEGQTRFLTRLTDDPSKNKVPDYMNTLNNTNSRIMTRFHLRLHKVAVVTGAWTGTLIPDRVCTTCGVLEDEVHFLCECRRLTSLRRQYLTNFVSRFPSAASAIQLMRSTDSKVLNNLWIYIRKD